MKKLVIFITVCCLSILVGCSEKGAQQIPDCGIPQEHLNQEITIYFIKDLNSYKIGDFVATYILLEKKIEISAPIDFNARLFKYDSEAQKWEEVKNSVTYIGGDAILNSKNTSYPLSVNPDVQNTEGPVKMFLCIKGNINNELRQIVGANTVFSLFAD
jgi:hypothetical protein